MEFFETVGGGVLVLSGVRILKSNDVVGCTPSYHNTCHSLSLGFLYGDSAVCLVVKESQAKEFKPGLRFVLLP